MTEKKTILNRNKIHHKKNLRTTNKNNTSKKSIKHQRNKKGGGLNDVYSSDDYKDTGILDFMKFDVSKSLANRGDPPPFPECTIL
jgi:hypothetical protein